MKKLVVITMVFFTAASLSARTDDWIAGNNNTQDSTARHYGILNVIVPGHTGNMGTIDLGTLTQLILNQEREEQEQRDLENLTLVVHVERLILLQQSSPNFPYHLPNNQS